MEKFTSPKQKIGKIGEDLAEKYLISKGFDIVCKNYTKKWGEIDVIAKKGSMIHFIEVKSVTVLYLPEKNIGIEENKDFMDKSIRPEENLHPKKIKRIFRTIQTYIMSKNMTEKDFWQFDLALVYIDMAKRQGRVKLMEDIIL